jgi:hypothetical protein
VKYDFPEALTIIEAVRAMDSDPGLEHVRPKVLRWHALNGETLRVFLKTALTASEQATLAAAWKSLRPKGTVEHVQA